MTQLQQAVKGVITEPMRQVAQRESVEVDLILREVASGRMVIPANKVHLEGRLNSLREMETIPGLPKPLKSVIMDMSVALGTEIVRFKRGDYS